MVATLGTSTVFFIKNILILKLFRKGNYESATSKDTYHLENCDNVGEKEQNYNENLGLGSG